MAKANLRIKEINKILSKSNSADSDSDDDLEDLDGLKAELNALQKSNAENQIKLDNYEKNKKWNVDNMCHVVEERTIVNDNVGESKFSSSGFALPKEAELGGDASKEDKATDVKVTTTPKAAEVKAEKVKSEVPTIEMAKANVTESAKPATTTTTAVTKPQPQPDSPLSSVSVSMLSYHEFTEKYADTGVHGFIKRIEVRAVEKRKEIDEERAREAKERGASSEDAVDVSTIPREERLGPGGLDPLEVFESLPECMQEAFESREKSRLEEALMSMKPEEAEYHMKRCVDSGLWNA
eukprot:scaffold43354_cov73-Cyclotella_meneghiniana.AAC.2